MTSRERKVSVEPALRNYFEELLQDPRDDEGALELIRKKKLQALLNQQSAYKVPQETAVKVEAVVEDAITQTPVLENAEPGNRFLAWHENGRPQWAQDSFEALLFEVSGLTLAVPLIALGQIQNINQELTPIFGQSKWFMGLLSSPQGQIKTLNTALFVMPERYDETFVSTARYVISIDGLAWGLAVDRVNQPVTLQPDEVKWRSNRSKRPWLAGTVKSAMCALLDIPQMAELLRDAEK